jgi:hypothetical protein
MRRGLTLLWNPEALAQLVVPDEAVSLRTFLRMVGSWPADLPAANGDAVVVVGLEGCLDALEPTAAADWLEGDLKGALLEFQDEYQGQAALIFWLPSGRSRIRMDAATEEYSWLCEGAFKGQSLALGRHLWAGAESDVHRLLSSKETSADPDGSGWIGLFHPRIS